jgi:protocatechuate 3,4-dioxygenase beta subunit
MSEFVAKDLDRRRFLYEVGSTLAVLPLLSACSVGTVAQGESSVLAKLRRNALPIGGEWSGAIEAPADVSWRTELPVTKGDGDRIRIAGTVFASDGKTPSPNTLIYFYHTDKFGIYGRGNEHKHGRYRGWLLTDEKGRYEFSSIRPASYPNSTQSQHIHMTVTTLDKREDWIDSILFEGDRFITSRERQESGKRGGFQPIVTLTKGSDEIMTATRDILIS